MKASVLALALFACVVGGHAADTNPVAKVLELLGELQGKIIKEGEAAQKVYEEFSEWCEDRSANVGFEIKTGKAEVEELKATIEKETADIAAFASQVEELSGTIAAAESNLKNATEIREKEAADFAAEDAELADVINTLERAIDILEREMAKGGASMLQLQRAGSLVQALGSLVQASVLSSADVTRLTALLQDAQTAKALDESEDHDAQTEKEDEDVAMLGAPDPAAYKGKSGGIIETLEGLLEKAETQLKETRDSETKAQHEYELLKQSLEDEIKFSNADLEKAQKGSAEATEAKAVAEGDLAVTSKDLAEDIKVLSTLHHDCLTKAQDFEIETKSRGEELKALAAAKKAIKEMTGGAEDITYGLTQVSFFQRDSSRILTSTADLKIFEAVRLVKDLARKVHSSALMQLASRMDAAFRLGGGSDPFGKVRDLIKELIDRLVKEGQAEAGHKAFCDKEMAETEAQKEDKSADVDKLTTKIDTSTARSAKLKEEIAQLQKELAELAASQAEMDKLRADEKAVFEANKPEMEAGIEGIKLALKILRDYYANAEKGHSAAEGAGTSIIGMLEVAEADFTKGLAEMVGTEAAAQKAYEVKTQENKLTKMIKDQDVKYKTKEASELDAAVSELKSDLATVQKELDAVLEYLAKLHEMCIAKAEPYEERKKRREAEIAGLKEALKILEGTALVQVRRSLRNSHPHV